MTQDSLDVLLVIMITHNNTKRSYGRYVFHRQTLARSLQQFVGNFSCTRLTEMRLFVVRFVNYIDHETQRKRDDLRLSMS